MAALRTIRLVLWGLVAVALFAVGALTAAQYLAPRPQSALSAGQPLGGPFQLVDQNGQPVTEAIFRGKPSAVLFGFTHCPDVCPTALFEMGEWAKALGPDADKMRFVFVTVDPERDTPEAMREYLSAFSGKITGVTGEPDKVAAMLKDHHVFFSKVPTEGGTYTMDHTASVFLLDGDGALAGTIDSKESREPAVAKLRRLVAG
jgi:protein SCO1/2